MGEFTDLLTGSQPKAKPRFTDALLGAKSETKPAEPTTERGSLTDAVVQGVSFGFADEIAGAAAVVADKALGAFDVRPPRPAGEVFEEGRARKEQEIENIPAGARIPLEIVGGAVSGGPAGKAIVQGLGKLPGFVKPIVAGGVEGAVAGAGFAQPGERGLGAVQGAGTGVVLGVAIPLTIAGINKAIASSGTLKQLGAAGRRAARRVLEALENDDLTLDQATARLNKLGAEGVLADVGEENLKQLAQAVTGTAGKGRRQAGRILTQRSKGSAKRVIAAVRGVVSGDDAGDVIARLTEERSNAAKPLYNAAYSIGEVFDDELNDLITRSKPIRDAIANAKAIDPQLADLPDNHMVLLDRAYKALGGKANKARVSGDGVLSNTLNDLRVRFRDKLVALAPVYGDALDTFAGQSTLIDAVELGKDVLKPKGGVTAKMVSDLTDSEREMFKVGVADAMVNLVESGTSASGARKLLRTVAIERRIKQAFGRDLGAFREYMSTLQKEIKFAATSNLRFGSKTAPLASEVARVADAATDAVDAVAGISGGGSPVRSILSLARGQANRRPAIPRDVNTALGDLLFSPGRGTDALRAVQQNSLNNFARQIGAGLPAIGGINAPVQDEFGPRRRR